MEAVLQDGSRAWCVFPGLEILRTEAVFPGDILSAREAGGKYFFLCSEYPVLASNDRILMFGEDVYDEEVSYAVDSDGKRIPLSRRPFLILSEQGDPVAQISAGGLFVLADSDGTARGVDARTGRTRWEATVGGHDEYVEYVGITGDGSRMVFRDYGPSGEIAFRQSDKEGPSREELWKILRTEDGQIETIRNPEGDLFGGRPCSIIRAAVGTVETELSKFLTFTVLRVMSTTFPSMFRFVILIQSFIFTMLRLDSCTEATKPESESLKTKPTMPLR